MFSFRDVVVFLAGAEFFHTISHIFFGYFVRLPIDMKVMVLTPTLNLWATIINAAITIFLLWFSTKLKR